MTVKATDEDKGENGRVSYHLKVGNKNVQETEEFAIDQESGELRSKIILDREVKSKYEVCLCVSRNVLREQHSNCSSRSLNFPVQFCN